MDTSNKISKVSGPQFAKREGQFDALVSGQTGSVDGYGGRIYNSGKPNLVNAQSAVAQSAPKAPPPNVGISLNGPELGASIGYLGL